MIKRIFKYLVLLILLIFYLTYNKIYADTNVNVYYNHNYNWSNSGNTEPSGPPEPNGSYSVTLRDNNGKNHNYKCEFYYSTNVSTTVTVNSYNINGKSLMNGSTIIDEIFKSGTWIGLRNTETKVATWNVDQGSIKCKEVLYSYTCAYKKKITNSSTQIITSTIGPTNTATDCDTKCENKNPRYPDYRWPTPGTTNICTCIRYQTTTSSSFDYKYKNYTNEPTNECPNTHPDNGDYTLYQKTNEKSHVYENNNNEALTKATEEAKRVAKAEAIAKLNGVISTVEILEEKSNGELNSKTLQLNSYVNSEYDPYKVNEEGTYYGKYTKVYEFRPHKVCLNIITGAINYRESGNCQTDEKDVTEGLGTDGKKYWRYFIPLNTLSGSNFYIRLGKKNSNTKLSKEECASVMESYPLEDDYLHYIKRKSGEEFKGMQTLDEETVKNDGGCRRKNGAEISVNNCLAIMNEHQMHNDYTHYIKSLSENFTFTDKKVNESYNINNIKQNKGCRFSVTINYNIEQKFYGEDKKSEYISLKGYGTYFRQIDINNPFPNGIDTKSLWNGLYDTNTRKINTGNGEVKLTDFDTITYIAKISGENAKKIRIFNDETSYTKWTKDYSNQNGMNANGTSNFVRNNNTIFTKLQSKNSFYNLGCGPANKDWSGCS